jgi:hypothetical protein
MKIWQNDPRFGCTTRHKSIVEYFEIEDDVVLENEDLVVDFKLFEEYWHYVVFLGVECILVYEEQTGNYLIIVGIWFFVISICWL